MIMPIFRILMLSLCGRSRQCATSGLSASFDKARFVAALGISRLVVAFVLPMGLVRSQMRIRLPTLGATTFFG